MKKTTCFTWFWGSGGRTATHERRSCQVMITVYLAARHKAASEVIQQVEPSSFQDVTFVAQETQILTAIAQKRLRSETAVFCDVQGSTLLYS